MRRLFARLARWLAPQPTTLTVNMRVEGVQDAAALCDALRVQLDRTYRTYRTYRAYRAYRA